jgi:hypothetical protein
MAIAWPSGLGVFEVVVHLHDPRGALFDSNLTQFVWSLTGGTCSVSSHTARSACLKAGGTWSGGVDIRCARPRRPSSG